MKPSVKLFTLLVVPILFIGCTTAPQPPDTAAMLASASALDESFVAAYNQGDADALAALYWNSPDVVSFLPDQMEVRGHDAIRAANAAAFEGMAGAHLELTESHQMPAGDVVIGWGLWRLTMPAADGTTQEMTGRYTDVKAERDGKWVYLLDHASVPAPPPPADE